ncbi:methylthioribose-1-phosphate isomerase [Ooceraea biroi]|uniref:Methylthioribose-1-phosphate isomerase n=1 Tax=Ooceraea biroi TaxID=2015173 RepID=A0A026X1N3_OOCBI|nr:methylthioribose-1-phosphate isomerase [Ooceraea biroi]EZA61921.1 Methylthioribose-1-phosphate isomerase [Ooceraea biroi]
MTLQAIQWEKQEGRLQILDQKLLPDVTQYSEIKGVGDGWKAINSMQVRGAPAIAIVGCLSLAVEIIHNPEYVDKAALCQDIESKLNYLISARPTAVNMNTAANELITLAENLYKDATITLSQMIDRFVNAIDGMLRKDVADNIAIGDLGAHDILYNVPKDSVIRILTHCNTGSLATAGYGTALGVIRSLHKMGKLERVYCTETRPYNQGARLTAYELVHDKIPATLICDDMVAAALRKKQITAVVVGADRVAANGDTANKIGTYQIAVLAKYHKIPFYVAAPRTSIDLTMPSGDDMVIEERPVREMTHINGRRVAAKDIDCWNPAFDVTPASLITGIITDIGVFKPEDLKVAIEEHEPVCPRLHEWTYL